MQPLGADIPRATALPQHHTRAQTLGGSWGSTAGSSLIRGQIFYALNACTQRKSRKPPFKAKRGDAVGGELVHPPFPASWWNREE